MKYKYAIGSGCSFGRENWVKSMSENLSNEYITLSNPGAGNTQIIFRLISKINELIQLGIEPESILVVNMLSDYNRADILINKEDIIEYSQIVESSYDHGGPDRVIFVDDSGETEERNHKEELNKIPYPNQAFLKTGGLERDTGHDNYLKFIREWYKKYYSKESMFVNTLKEILILQGFCKERNIDCFFTVWQNIFHHRIGEEVRPCELDKIYFKSYDKPLMKDVYPMSKIYWDIIDLDKFIFYENSEIEMGGNAEFSIYNDIPLGWDGDDIDTTHPNNESNKLFGEYIEDKIKEYCSEI
jgi:hypothetical protein